MSEGNKRKNESTKRTTLQSIQRLFFRTQIVLIVTLALFLGISGTLINIHFETQKRDQNLKNIAEAIARSPLLAEMRYAQEDSIVLWEYLDSLKDTLGDIDVISVVDHANVRRYHSNHELIGTVYDGTIPRFEAEYREYYAADDSGPSGNQRRAYAAIYNEEGDYVGFVIAVMLMENIRQETFQTLFTFALFTLAAVLMELIISIELSSKIRSSLMGYEPDVFSAMYRIRDNILESLDEGVIAIDKEGRVQFANRAAASILDDSSIVGKKLNSFESGEHLFHMLDQTGREFNIQERVIRNADILIDRIPIKENNEHIGIIGILHNRKEYTQLMEELAGTRYLVDSMRANNHDFTNKLHVILGLIQMEMYEEAVAYIENITIVQRETISSIMKAVDEPAVAALLIGKTARASELNVKFILREDSHYSRNDMSLPTEALVTIIGNLIDNAFESMNESDDVYSQSGELMFGLYSRPGAVLITAADMGTGISQGNINRIFDNGYSTKGEGRGTGLYQVKSIVDGLGGVICVESQIGAGTSFTVQFGGSEQKGEGQKCTVC